MLIQILREKHGQISLKPACTCVKINSYDNVREALQNQIKGENYMNFYRIEQMPGFIKTEMQKIQKAVQPLMKKTVIYRFLAVPLAAFSLFNLAAFLFHASADRESLISAGLFALLAALGLAFFKEAGYQHKQIQKTVHIYMLNRIKKSEILSEERKNTYTRQIKEEPFAMRSFVEFLTEEDRRKKMLY